MKGSGRPRAGSVRRTSRGKQVGTGGHGRKALEGKGPTPKAEDRSWHVAGKRKAAVERQKAAAGKGRTSPRQGMPRGAAGAAQRAKTGDGTEIVTGRNAVLEALRAKIPTTALYLAQRIEMDERIKEVLKIATNRNIPVMEVTRVEVDRLAGDGAVHQGIAIKVPAYDYAHPIEVLDDVLAGGAIPLLVALDGVTDPRNLGAIIRSTAAFGGQGVVVPQRRSAGVTAAAWKTSAGAAARIPVAMAANMTQTLKTLKARGVFVIGLDGGGDINLPGLTLADRPVVIVVGSEGAGLSRLVAETCDVVVSIPISAATESLNAGIAASVALYEISRLRKAAGK